ncbi:hypothetical protein [Robbsia andropogonis]|uniref:hypothetical protein n=1 Tax=Robbsia andropogonis TaxID=28092 RepID=UPI002A699240|nr:hypothetical protein [Robbsia andropogonis]
MLKSASQSKRIAHEGVREILDSGREYEPDDAEGLCEGLLGDARLLEKAIAALERQAAHASAQSERAAALDDLSTLVRRLVRELRKASPSNDLSQKALDYLERAGLKPNVLRESAQSVECQHRIADARNPVVKSGYICVDCGALFSAADHSGESTQSERPVDEADIEAVVRAVKKEGVPADLADAVAVSAIDALIARGCHAQSAEGTRIPGLGSMTDEDDGFVTLQFKDESAAQDFMMSYSPSVSIKDMPEIDRQETSEQLEVILENFARVQAERDSIAEEVARLTNENSVLRLQLKQSVEPADVRDAVLEEAADAVWQYRSGETISKELMCDIAAICALVRNMKSKRA